MAKRIRDLSDQTTINNTDYFVLDEKTGTTKKVSFLTLKNSVKPILDDIVQLKKFKITPTFWYRIWSDGWCEQGGKQATETANNIQEIKFPVIFKDTNIFINATPCGTDLGDNYHQGIWLRPSTNHNITTEHFYYRNDLEKGEYIMWEAKGMVNLENIVDT